MLKLKEVTKPNHDYKVTFGVRQTEALTEKCNKENKTPQTYIKEKVMETVELGLEVLGERK